MKLSTVFRRAAELIAEGEEDYSCDAVLHASNGKVPHAMFFWREHFKPREDSPEHYWLRDEHLDNEKEWRILALLFASAMAKSEGL